MEAINTAWPLLTDAGICRFLIESESFYPHDAVELSVAQQRDLYNTMCAHFRKPRPASVHVTDVAVHATDVSIPVRIYVPVSSAPLPAVLYLHGGGFVVGDLESHDDICAEIADRANTAVIAVAYRLAPEYPFPAAFNDCREVLLALPMLAQEYRFDAEQLVIGGDSAGGSLAAGLCLDARDRGGPSVAGQVLVYPGLGGNTNSGSYVTQSEAPGLTARDIEYYRELYVGVANHAHQQNKFANPLRETNYHGLPPAYLVAAQHDPLCDDCAEYARQLKQVGVAVQLREEPLLIHSFLRARYMSDPAGKSFDAIVAAIASLAHNGVLP